LAIDEAPSVPTGSTLTVPSVVVRQSIRLATMRSGTLPLLRIVTWAEAGAPASA
jgi:hypothetical protein